MCFLVLGSGNYFSAIVSQEVSYIFSTTLTQNFGPQQQDKFLLPCHLNKIPMKWVKWASLESIIFVFSSTLTPHLSPFSR